MVTPREKKADLEAETARMSNLDDAVTALTKPWYASKAVWGGMLAVLFPLLGALGHQLAPEEMAVITDMLAMLGAMVGGVLAIYGRIKARKVVV